MPHQQKWGMNQKSFEKKIDPTPFHANRGKTISGNSYFNRPRSFEEGDVNKNRKACFLCGQFSHKAFECRNRNVGMNSKTEEKIHVENSGSQGGGATSNLNSGGRDVFCKFWNRPGHKFEKCFKRLNSMAAVEMVGESDGSHFRQNENQSRFFIQPRSTFQTRVDLAPTFHSAPGYNKTAEIVIWPQRIRLIFKLGY